nr:uncharacterized protein LOC112095587 [Ipomoea trifida]
MTTVDAESLGQTYAALSIEDGEEGVIVGLDENDAPVVNLRFIVVGRVVTDRPVRFTLFRDVMASVWRPARGVSVKDIGEDRFLFQFYHEMDVARVTEDGLWSFDQNLVVLRRLDNGESPVTVPLNIATFWVQVHKLPVSFMSEKVVKVIADYIGSFVRSDPTNFTSQWKTFLRRRGEAEKFWPGAPSGGPEWGGG